MPEITAMVNSPPEVMGVANIRGQMITVINLPMVVGCKPTKGLGILLVTEFARTTQAFAVEEVNEIVRLEWKHVLSAENSGGGLVTSIARLDGAVENTRLAQVLDVEQILRDVMPQEVKSEESKGIPKLRLEPGQVILAADDSAVARMMIEKGFKSMDVPYIMTKTGKEAWERLQAMHAAGGGRRQAHQGQSSPGAHRPGNARDGWFHADPQHQAGRPVQPNSGHHPLVTDGVHQRKSCEKRRG